MSIVLEAPPAAVTEYAKAPLALLIDGQWREGSSGRTRDVLDPTTGEVLAAVPTADRSDVDAAIAAAARAFPRWRDLPVDERTRILMKAAAIMRERADAIARIATIEEGKTFAEMRGEVLRCAKALEWDAQDAKRAYGRIIPIDNDTELTVRHEPVGPVGALVPWNFPVGSPNRKIAGAISAGCSLVLKASDETPATAVALVACYQDAGLPDGVLNLVFGHSAEIAEQFVRDERIRLIAFTGSIPNGKDLAAKAGAEMKPMILELGGHAPVIVCEDADPKLAARRTAAAKYANAGQVCTSPSRILVHRSIYREFLDELVKASAEVKVGFGLDEGVTMGPLANERRLVAMERLVADAVARGARVEIGGKRIGTRGYFFEPTVLSDVPLDADIMREEPFGPVAPVVAFDDLEEALAIANALPYGLAAYGFTEKAATADRLIRGLEAGILSINHCGGSVPEAPSGGVKQSGIGREGGQEGLEAYLVVKRVSHKLR